MSQPPLPVPKKSVSKADLSAAGQDGWVLGGVVSVLLGLVVWVNAPQPEVVLEVTPVVSLRQGWLPPLPEANNLPPSVYAKALGVHSSAVHSSLVSSYAPSQGKKQSLSGRKSLPPLASININQASASQLEVLPQVGPKLAQRIVLFRKQHGTFTTIEALDAVKGIGPKLLQRIRPYLKPL